MEGKDIIKLIKVKETPYKRTVYILKRYRDIKNGNIVIDDVPRSIINVMDKVFDLIKDDEYYPIIELHYMKGFTIEKTANVLSLERTTVYRQKRRLIRRISLILYGDEALIK